MSPGAGLPSHVVRERNFYPKDDPSLHVTPAGDPITNYSIHELWPALKDSARFKERYAAVQAFNAANKWKKRGISMTTTKYKVAESFMGALVNAYKDGSVVISHGGCEIGQGIHTKVHHSARASITSAVLLHSSDPWPRLLTHRRPNDGPRDARCRWHKWRRTRWGNCLARRCRSTASALLTPTASSSPTWA